jgi:hypothetical protein
MLATSSTSIAAAKHHEAARNRRALNLLTWASNPPNAAVA